MYKSIIRPILFLISPEKVHHLIIGIIKFFTKMPFVPYLLKKAFCIEDKSLETELAGLKFPNPVGLAAGFDKNATFYNEFSNFGFGFIEIGTVTPKAQFGNLKPRSFRLVKDSALINRMGFNNDGLDRIVQRLIKPRKILIGGNIGKNTDTENEYAVDDYLKCFIGLYSTVDYFVVNVSCPNITNLSKLQNQESLEKILGQIASIRSKQHVYRPIFLKISPDLNYKQIDETINIVQNKGIDGLVVTNTTVLRDNLVTDTVTVKQIGKGGLSGKPIKNRSTELIKYINTKTSGNLPIIGVGGIMSPEDAIEKLEAGAKVIQIYTGFIYEGPALVKKINKAILKART